MAAIGRWTTARTARWMALGSLAVGTALVVAGIGLAVVQPDRFGAIANSRLDAPRARGCFSAAS